MTLAGNILRKSEEEITKIINETLPKGIRPIGRPRAKWKGQVHEDMQVDGTGRGGC